MYYFKSKYCQIEFRSRESGGTIKAKDEDLWKKEKARQQEDLLFFSPSRTNIKIG